MRLRLHTLPKIDHRRQNVTQKKSEIIYHFFRLLIFCKINKFMFSSEFTYFYICRLILYSLFIRGYFYWHIFHIYANRSESRTRRKMAQSLDRCAVTEDPSSAQTARYPQSQTSADYVTCATHIRMAI